MQPNEPCGSHTGAHPIDCLEREHALILRVLDAAEDERIQLTGGMPMREEFWHGYLDFMANYADRCHHGKEEGVLFLALEARGLQPHSGPTGCMRTEHDEMRATRARLAEALTSDDVETITHLVRTGVEAQRIHIAKENQVVFPMARQMLDDRLLAAIAEGFEAVEQSMGEGAHARFEELAASLCRELPESAHS